MLNYFEKPKIIGIIADVNEGKSNLIYHLIKNLKENYKFNLVTFGLRCEVEGAREINSLEELEETTDSVIFLDEFFTLFDLDDRQKKRQIELSLRLLNHKNNILVLVGVPENFKKFIASKLDVVFFKKVTISDFINGSAVKKLVVSYEGREKGNKVLNLKKSETIVYGKEIKSYDLFPVPYLKEFDSKINNKIILVEKKCGENV